jgi:putative CocE/NonD family hydrolase
VLFKKKLFYSILIFSVSIVCARSFEVIEHTWIPLADGTRLAARVWIPETAIQEPVPAILEYIPYRKRDGTRLRDESKYDFFAREGYACLRVDLRGSGESDGFLDDEYLKKEQDDALEVIDWIAQQPWCSGSIGIMGKSWGGFNALQIAACQPQSLKAIITVCSTDDRYADDIHYMGGCLLNDNLWWGAIMLAYQARPADPELVGDQWRQQLLERIEKMPFWPALWLKHQRRDAYWQHGSVCENWSNIKCPVFAIGGWTDAYSNAIPRMLESLLVPRLGLIGPWAHLYPDDGVPGPAIDFLNEALRWWDHWLKGKDTGIMKEPMLRAYIEEWSPPAGWRDPAPGRWVGEDVWPSQRIEKQCLYFSLQGLSRKQLDETAELSIKSPQFTGLAVGEWMGVGVPGDMPLDQRLDDGCSLTFDTLPLKERFELLGSPELVLNIASDKPIAHICARLCDVSPDGSSRRISYQVLNLTHRNSHEHPDYLEPGLFYQIKIKLNDCGYAIPAGHCLRVALSTTYWPLIWPAPEAVTLTISTQGSFLMLPVRLPRQEDALIHFDLPRPVCVSATTKVAEGSLDRSVKFDLLTGKTTYITDGKGGMFGGDVILLDDVGVTFVHDLKRELTIDKDDPLSACYVLAQNYEMLRKDVKFVIKSRVEMKSNQENFFLTGTLDVFEDDFCCARKSFNEVLSRDYL